MANLHPHSVATTGNMLFYVDSAKIRNILKEIKFKLILFGRTFPPLVEATKNEFVTFFLSAYYMYAKRAVCLCNYSNRLNNPSILLRKVDGKFKCFA